VKSSGRAVDRLRDRWLAGLARSLNSGDPVYLDADGFYGGGVDVRSVAVPLRLRLRSPVDAVPSVEPEWGQGRQDVAGTVQQLDGDVLRATPGAGTIVICVVEVEGGDAGGLLGVDVQGEIDAGQPADGVAAPIQGGNVGRRERYPSWGQVWRGRRRRRKRFEDDPLGRVARSVACNGHLLLGPRHNDGKIALREGFRE